jgi:hypothetical protein
MFSPPSPGFFLANMIGGNQDKNSVNFQRDFEVTKGRAGLGLKIEIPNFATANAISPTNFAVPTGLDLSFLDDGLSYVSTTPSSSNSPQNTIFINTDFLRVIQAATITDHENGIFTPPSSPILGPHFADDGGHQEDLRNIIFDEAASCIFPEELLPEYQGTIPFWAENVYVDGDLVASPMEIGEC